MDESKGLLSVTIDFDRSHLFFPRIVIGILILLLLIIGITNLIKYKKRGNLKESVRAIRFFEENYDKVKLFGTIGLLVVYFWSMDHLGRLFPNQGLGFLIASIPYMFVQAMLFVGKDNVKKHLVAISVTSVLTPLFSWILFGKLFFITLP